MPPDWLERLLNFEREGGAGRKGESRSLARLPAPPCFPAPCAHYVAYREYRHVMHALGEVAGKTYGYLGDAKSTHDSLVQECDLGPKWEPIDQVIHHIIESRLIHVMGRTCIRESMQLII